MKWMENKAHLQYAKDKILHVEGSYCENAYVLPGMAMWK